MKAVSKRESNIGLPHLSAAPEPMDLIYPKKKMKKKKKKKMMMGFKPVVKV